MSQSKYIEKIDTKYVPKYLWIETHSLSLHQLKTVTHYRYGNGATDMGTGHGGGTYRVQNTFASSETLGETV
jgi:hypothetical protein